MGTDIRSILRVGLITKSCTANTAVLDSDDIIGNQDITADNIIPKQRGGAWYTIQFVPSVDGNATIEVTDGTTTKVAKCYTCKSGELAIFSVTIAGISGNSGDPSDPWELNLKYSETGTLDILCIYEHGGIV